MYYKQVFYLKKIVFRCLIITVIFGLNIFTFSAYGQKGDKVTHSGIIIPDVFDRRYLAMDQTLHSELKNLQMVMGQAGNHKMIFERFDDRWLETCNIDGYEYICGVFVIMKGVFVCITT